MRDCEEEMGEGGGGRERERERERERQTDRQTEKERKRQRERERERQRERERERERGSMFPFMEGEIWSFGVKEERRRGPSNGELSVNTLALGSTRSSASRRNLRRRGSPSGRSRFPVAGSIVRLCISVAQ